MRKDVETQKSSDGIDAKQVLYTTMWMLKCAFYVYFKLLENSELTKQNIRAPSKAIRNDSLPPFKTEQFTLTAEQRKWF